MGLLAQHIKLGDKCRYVGTGFAANAADRVVQSATTGAGRVLQLLDAARAYAARRKIDHAHETGVIARVLEQTQIRQRVFDFSALEKAQTAIHAVRHGCVEQRGFNHPALCVAAVENGDLAARCGAFFAIAVASIAQQLFDLFHNPIGFCQIAGRLHHTHRFTRALRGVQVFTETGFVVFDQLVGCVQNVAVAAVVLFQLNLMLHRELMYKVGHIAHARTAKRVNALVIVTDCQHSAVRAAKQFDPSVLQFVGVLKLVNQNMFEALAVMFAQRIVVAQ